MSRSRSETVAVAVLVTVAVGARILTLTLDPVSAGASTGLGVFWDAVLLTAILGVYLVLACLLISRQPRQPIGWLMVAIVLSGALGSLSEAVTAESPTSAGAEPWWWQLSAWFRNWYFGVFIGAFILVFHLFPTGRPIPGRLAWATRTAFAAVALLTVMFMTGPPDGSNPPNPGEVDFPIWVRRPATWLFAALMVVALVSIVPILIVRFRRSRGDERQQLKWFLFCVVTVLSMWWLQFFASWLFLPAILLPAIAIGVALLRYRLYDIDRIVSRTTSYAVVTGVLLATYAVIVVSVTKLLPNSPTLAVAGATLAAAALARPLLGRVQHVVDRRFDRARYDAIRTVDAFGAQLRNEIDQDQIQVSLLATVQSSLQPDRLTVWVQTSTTSANASAAAAFRSSGSG